MAVACLGMEFYSFLAVMFVLFISVHEDVQGTKNGTSTSNTTVTPTPTSINPSSTSMQPTTTITPTPTTANQTTGNHSTAGPTKPSNHSTAGPTKPATNSSTAPTKPGNHSTAASTHEPASLTPTPEGHGKGHDSGKWVATGFAIFFLITTIVMTVLYCRQRKIYRELEGDSSLSRLI